MWSEKMRADWQHTACLVAYIIEVNRQKGRKISPDEINPMEKNNRFTAGSSGIPLNTPQGFDALAAVSDQWRRP